MSVTTSYFPPLFVINLERSSDRRKHITSQLDALGLHCEIFPASDGARLSEHELGQYDEAYVIGQIARPMSRSEVGCYLSHTGAWQKIVEEGIPWAVVLEDDIEIHSDLKAVLSAISSIPCDWDVIRLAGLGPTPSRPLCDLDGNHRLSVLLQGASGTQALCISRKGAQKLLRYAYPKIRGTIDDHVIDNSWKTGLRILAVQPYPVSENRKFGSSIESERRQIFQRSGKRTDKRTLRSLAVRRRYKLGRSIGRRAYILTHALFWLQCKAKLLFRGNA
jgi:glycosyl transferase family 25